MYLYDLNTCIYTTWKHDGLIKGGVILSPHLIVFFVPKGQTFCYRNILDHLGCSSFLAEPKEDYKKLLIHIYSRFNSTSDSIFLGWILETRLYEKEPFSDNFFFPTKLKKMFHKDVTKGCPPLTILSRENRVHSAFGVSRYPAQATVGEYRR